MLYYIVILFYLVLSYMTLQKPYISIENNYMKILIYIVMLLYMLL